jgi:hypothetical protein
MRSLKSLVKNKTARFAYYRDGALHYQIGSDFLFPIPVDEMGSATYNAEEKAILLMRYIRRQLKVIENSVV